MKTATHQELQDVMMDPRSLLAVIQEPVLHGDRATWSLDLVLRQRPSLVAGLPPPRSESGGGQDLGSDLKEDRILALI